jgi:hypothetical protein
MIRDDFGERDGSQGWGNGFLVLRHVYMCLTPGGLPTVSSEGGGDRVDVGSDSHGEIELARSRQPGIDF